MCTELYDEVSASRVSADDDIRWRDALVQQVSECHVGLVQLGGERIIGHHRCRWSYQHTERKLRRDGPERARLLTMLQNGDAEVAQGS